jgi:predicted nicotinamide N-methyase
LINTQNDWTAKALTTTSAHQPTRIIELGAGTGLCGLMLAKAATNCHVTITDLPELLPLMQRNVFLNFGGSDPGDSKYCSLDDACWRVLLQDRQEQTHRHRASSLGTADVAARVLCWGVEQDYSHVETFDVVLGADVVASLYDPLLLAQTIHSLSHDKSMVYVSYKGRLTGPHKQFQAALLELFERVEVLRPHPNCRNRNPDVFILKAEHKKRDVYEPKK